ncbi:MAG: cyclomaltodextrinase N-terminal domain-containing protein, partial [Luminiphilus sp.]
MTTRIVSLLVIFLVCGSPTLAAVDRIDPPNWWVGMEENSVQLMLYGRGIGGGHVGSQSPDVTITEVVSGDSANYLFVTLQISESANPQTAKLEFISRDGERTPIDYLL